MLSRIVSSSSRRDRSRGSRLSIRSQSRAVSSMRVPVGARTCSLIWPPSTAGKKSWPSHGTSSDRPRPAHAARKHDGEAPGPVAGTPRAARGSRARSRSKPLLEAALEAHEEGRGSCSACSASCSCAVQQVLRHRRHERARQDVRRQHREDDRLGQRHEQVARDAGEEEHRHEHDADAERRDERRHGDLLRRRRESPARSPCPARGCG